MKIPKVVAGYLPQRYVPFPGTHCGACRDFIRMTSECMITEPADVSGERGTCILFLRGKPHEYGIPLRLIPQSVVGYIEGKMVPTSCGRCKYYDKPGRPFSACSKVGSTETDEVESGGCCNAYEARGT